MDTDTTATPPDRSAEREHHRAILNELIDLGADMARMVHRQKKVQHDYEVETGTTVYPVPNWTVEFDLVMRGVRRTMHMLQHLDDVPKPARDPSSSRAFSSRIARRDASRQAAREGDGAEAGSDRDPAENLRERGGERLDTPDWHETFDTSRPPAEIIAAIRKDLGLPPLPAKRELYKRSNADLAALKQREARAGQGANDASPRPDRTERPERFFGIVAKPKRE